MDNYTSDFTVMHDDTPVATVYFNNGKTKIEKHVPDSIIQPFCGDRQDIMRVYDFLESRCYENGRADLKEILKLVGMTENNPWQWAWVSHGVTWEDHFWIRFPGETLTWKDVRLR